MYKTHNESWCQEVLDFTLDLTFAELYGIYWNIWEILIYSLDLPCELECY